ncbi:DUF2953 domain-containing protein [Microbacteriaceae bacterium 4G12]
MNWSIIILIIILLCFLIFITKISLKLSVFYTLDEKHAVLQIRVWFFRYTIDLLSFKKKGAKEQQNKTTSQKMDESTFLQGFEKLSDFIKTIEDIHTMSKAFLHKVKVRELKWTSHFGTGDAASTGMIAGLIWTIKGMLVGLVSNYMKVTKRPELNVNPIFQGEAIVTHLECLVSFRVGQALVLTIALLRYLRKNHSTLINKEDQVQQNV